MIQSKKIIPIKKTPKKNGTQALPRDPHGSEGNTRGGQREEVRKNKDTRSKKNVWDLNR